MVTYVSLRQTWDSFLEYVSHAVANHTCCHHSRLSEPGLASASKLCCKYVVLWSSQSPCSAFSQSCSIISVIECRYTNWEWKHCITSCRQTCAFRSYFISWSLCTTQSRFALGQSVLVNRKLPQACIASCCLRLQPVMFSCPQACPHDHVLKLASPHLASNCIQGRHCVILRLMAPSH